MNSTDSKPKSKAEREAEEKARRRAEVATIVAGLKQALGADEQLLGFARGRLAGGIRGKLSLGPEAFFAPFVNIGLTERRLVIQHINAETGRPGEILPHFYALGDIAALTFSDIETFGGESAARLTVRMHNDQHTRLRLRGQGNLESAQAIVEVFRSLTSGKRPTTTPTQRVCATCHHILDQPFKFCPYCGQLQDLTAEAPVATPVATDEPERTYPPTPPGPTEPEFLDAVPYQDAAVFRGPTVEDGLDFLTPEPAPQPTVAPEPEPSPTAEPEAVNTTTPAEDSAFETPSSFEGWSVDPGASSSVVEPPAAEAETAPNQDYTTESSVVIGYAVDTEASIAEPRSAEANTPTEPVDLAENQTDVHAVEETPPNVHPEAEFAPIPEPLAFTPEEAHAPVTFDAPPVESVATPDPVPVPQPEPVVAATTPDFSSSPLTVEAPQEEAVPETETRSMAPTEFDAPPAFESFSEVAPSAATMEEFAAPNTVVAAPTHESAGFVTEFVASEGPTPVTENFEPFAPVPPTLPVAESGVSAEMAEPTVAPAFSTDHAPVAMAESVTPPVAPETTSEAAPATEPSPSEDRFAALLKEIRGGEAPPQATPEPPPAPERRDGPMSVQVHINRPPIVINESFTGRNADEVVGKLKARVLPELNFAQRMMVNAFSNLRFAQELVHRYNTAEKANYPTPNSCWEFLLGAEDINLVTLHLDR